MKLDGVSRTPGHPITEDNAYLGQGDLGGQAEPFQTSNRNPNPS